MERALPREMKTRHWDGDGPGDDDGGSSPGSDQGPASAEDGEGHVSSERRKHASDRRPKKPKQK